MSGDLAAEMASTLEGADFAAALMAAAPSVTEVEVEAIVALTRSPTVVPTPGPTASPTSLPTPGPTNSPTSLPTFNSCMSFEFHGTSPYNTACMGTYTYAGEHNGRPWFQHSGGFFRMYLADHGDWGIGNTDNELGSTSVYWYTADVAWPTLADGAWVVYSGDAWEPMTAEHASASCVPSPTPVPTTTTRQPTVSCTDYEVTMADSYGDGWNGDVLHIGSHEVTLESGSSGTATVCLEDGVYTPYACGGSYPSEVSWEVGALQSVVSACV